MKIIFKGHDGSIAIMELAPGADKEDALRKFHEAHPGQYGDHIEGNIKLPESREFRDAWTISEKGSIIINKEKAFDIHMARVRAVRNDKLKELDSEALRYLSDAEKLKDVEARKQLLRDLPQNVKGLNWPSDMLGERKC